jgi:hypothetical protein
MSAGVAKPPPKHIFDDGGGDDGILAEVLSKYKKLN